jgi:hypothetical protein
MSFGLAFAIGTIPVLCFALGYLCGQARSHRRERVPFDGLALRRTYGPFPSSERDNRFDDADGTPAPPHTVEFRRNMSLR